MPNIGFVWSQAHQRGCDGVQQAGDAEGRALTRQRMSALRRDAREGSANAKGRCNPGSDRQLGLVQDATGQICMPRG